MKYKTCMDYDYVVCYGGTYCAVTLRTKNIPKINLKLSQSAFRRAPHFYLKFCV